MKLFRWQIEALCMWHPDIPRERLIEFFRRAGFEVEE